MKKNKNKKIIEHPNAERQTDRNVRSNIAGRFPVSKFTVCLSFQPLGFHLGTGGLSLGAALSGLHLVQHRLQRSSVGGQRAAVEAMGSCTGASLPSKKVGPDKSQRVTARGQAHRGGFGVSRFRRAFGSCGREFDRRGVK